MEALNAELAHRVKSLGIGHEAREVLAEKLTAFYRWKDMTQRDALGRRRLQLTSLRNHFATVKLTLTWVKPYLSTLRRQSMSAEYGDSPELASMVDAVLSDVELLAKRKVTADGPFAVVLTSMQFLTRPPGRPRPAFWLGATEQCNGALPGLLLVGG